MTAKALTSFSGRPTESGDSCPALYTFLLIWQHVGISLAGFVVRPLRLGMSNIIDKEVKEGETDTPSRLN